MECVTLFNGTGRLIWATDCLPGCESVEGRHVWDMVHPEDRAEMQASFLDCQMGTVRSWTSRICPDQERVTLLEGEFRPGPRRPVAVIATSRIIDQRVACLSKRERQVCYYLARMPAKQIGAKLGISASAVDTYKGRVIDKTGLSGISLLRWCFEQFS